MMPYTSRWDAQGGPTPKGEVAAPREDAKKEKKDLSLFSCLSLSFSSINLIFFAIYYASIGSVIAQNPSPLKQTKQRKNREEDSR